MHNVRNRSCEKYGGTLMYPNREHMRLYIYMRIDTVWYM